MDTLLATCIDHGQAREGYGQTTYEGHKAYTHRVAYVQHHGLHLSDIDGQVVRHRCDNRRCRNAEHLLLGTQADNMADMWERTREAPHSKHYDAIRSEYIRGSKECGQAALALKYGLSQTRVSRIIKGT